jgi:hypothetical protein
MASFLDSLTKNARAAYPFIQSGVRQGLSSNSIARALSSAGLPLRRQALLDLVRLEKGATDYGRILRSLSKGAPMNVEALPESVTRIRRAYAFVVEVRGTTAGGGVLTKHVTVSTDNPALRPSDIEAAAAEMGEGPNPSGGVEVLSTSIVRGMRSGAAGTF